MFFLKNPKALPIVLAFVLLLAACSPAAAPKAPAAPPAEATEETPPLDAFSPKLLGDCYNPFNPVIEDRVWKYATQSGEISSGYESTYKDVTNSSFTSVQVFDGATTEVAWTCSPDGLLSSELANMSIAQVENISFDTLEVTGVMFPAESLWQPGYNWQVAFKVKIAFTVEETTFEGEGEISLDNTVAAIESVSVPAGNYSEAYRVDTIGNFKFSAMGVESSIPMNYSSWYVKEVGMVKSGSQNTDLSFSTELISMEG